MGLLIFYGYGALLCGPSGRWEVRYELMEDKWKNIFLVLRGTCKSTNYKISRGVMLCGGNKLRKRQEMRLIFKLGTNQPHGLNSDFRYL